MGVKNDFYTIFTIYQQFLFTFSISHVTANGLNEVDIRVQDYVCPFFQMCFMKASDCDKAMHHFYEQEYFKDTVAGVPVLHENFKVRDLLPFYIYALLSMH